MPGTRHKYNTKKPLILIASTSQFLKVISTDKVYSQFTVSPLNSNKQQNIYSLLNPQIITVNPIVLPKSIPILVPNYMRQAPNLYFPIANLYQLTALDLAFLEKHKLRLGYVDGPVLDEQLLKEAIVYLQDSCRRIGDEKNQGNWLHKIKINKKRSIEEHKSKAIEDIIFKYWYLRRKQFKFPIYRLSWKTTDNIPYLNAIYLPRNKRAMTAVQANRRISKYFLHELAQQLATVQSICFKIETREQLKIQQTQIELKDFIFNVKNILGSEFIEKLPSFVFIDIKEGLTKEGTVELQEQQIQSTQTLDEDTYKLAGIASFAREGEKQSLKTPMNGNPSIIRQMNIKISPEKKDNPNNFDNNFQEQMPCQLQYDSTNASNKSSIDKQDFIKGTLIKPLKCPQKINQQRLLSEISEDDILAGETFHKRRV